MDKDNFIFKVHFFRVDKNDRCPDVEITDDKNFDYSAIFNMYKGDRMGHGIQVNNPKLEKSLLKMCDKISQAVYDFQKENE